jgi:hypothetical protein
MSTYDRHECKIYSLSFAVREAALDLKALRRKIHESGAWGYEWRPAEATARQRLVKLARTSNG